MTGADEMAVIDGRKSENGKNHHDNLTKAEYETLADFRHQLRRFATSASQRREPKG